MVLGPRLKELRKQSGLTLQELSRLTSLSIGFLSNIERDLTSPSISNLQKICNALKIDLVNLIKPLMEDKIVIRANERREMFYSKRSKIRYELISEGNKKINGICIVMEKGADYGKIPVSHDSDELGIIVKGSLEIRIADNAYILSEGDTVYIDANLEHSYRNIGDTECVSYWVVMGNIDKNYG